MDPESIRNLRTLFHIHRGEPGPNSVYGGLRSGMWVLRSIELDASNNYVGDRVDR